MAPIIEPDGPVDLWRAIWWCIKWGSLAWLCAFLFLSCTGQLPSDPG